MKNLPGYAVSSYRQNSSGAETHNATFGPRNVTVNRVWQILMQKGFSGRLESICQTLATLLCQTILTCDTHVLVSTTPSPQILEQIHPLDLHERLLCTLQCSLALVVLGNGRGVVQVLQA